MAFVVRNRWKKSPQTLKYGYKALKIISWSMISDENPNWLRVALHLCKVYVKGYVNWGGRNYAYFKISDA